MVVASCIIAFFIHHSRSSLATISAWGEEMSDQIKITVLDGVDVSEVRAIAESVGGSIGEHVLDNRSAYFIEFDPPRAADALVDQLRTHPSVKSAFPEVITLD